MEEYLTKELVRSFDYSNACEDRTCYKKEVINGRTYYKQGTATATSVVGDLYRVDCPSEESFNYILLIGVARQHPCDVRIDKEAGIEVASVNAKIKPFATMKFPCKIGWETFRTIAETYIKSLPVELVQTIEELRAAGKDPSKYIR